MGVSLVVQRFQLMEPTFSHLPNLFSPGAGPGKPGKEAGYKDV
jgi:hypothetical protein